MRHFIGDRICRRVYSDNSDEIGKALKALKTMPETSQPGRRETNAIVERENQDMLGGIRTLLIEAGLPSEFWPFAAENYAFACTVMENEDQPAYFNRHGKYFKGAIIPFGAAIDVVPSPIQKQPKKFNPRGVPAVFLGYVIQPGQKWKGEYRFAELDDFRDVSLHRDVK